MLSNPRFANAECTLIDLDLEHPTLGIVPFTASDSDVEEHGRNIFASAKNGEFGAIKPFVKTDNAEDSV